MKYLSLFLSVLDKTRFNLALFLLFLTLISANSYNAFLHYNFPISQDGRDYFEMARGNYNVEKIHRYRAIIPLTVELISIPISKVYKHIWPYRAEDAWPLRFGFFIINTMIMAISSLFLFLICKSYGTGFFPALITTIMIISCRFTTYFAGLTLTDSLYYFMIIIMMYGLKKRNAWMISLAIIIGPLSKESFFLFYPLIFFFGSIGKFKQFMLYVFAILLLGATHYLIDNQVSHSLYSSVAIAADHLSNIKYTFSRLFSIKGFFEVFSVLGLNFIVLFMGFLGGKQKINLWLQYVDLPLVILFLLILIHMFLSSDIARMLFFAAPFWAVFLALILEYHPSFLFFSQFTSVTVK